MLYVLNTWKINMEQGALPFPTHFHPPSLLHPQATYISFNPSSFLLTKYIPFLPSPEVPLP